MAESTLAYEYNEIRVDVADFLGLSRSSAKWSADDIARIASAMKMGLNRFYNPPRGIAPEGFRWSFLSLKATLATVVSTEEYALPDDFGSLETGFQFTDESYCLHPKLVSQYRYNEWANWWGDSDNRPQVYAIIPQTTDGSTGQRFKVAFAPTPDAIYPLTYKYKVLTSALTDVILYPHGGAQHGETIRAACLASAQLMHDGEFGYWNRYFLEEALPASIRDDLASQSYDSLGMMYDPGEKERMDEETWLRYITDTVTHP